MPGLQETAYGSRAGRFVAQNGAGTNLSPTRRIHLHSRCKGTEKNPYAVQHLITRQPTYSFARTSTTRVLLTRTLLPVRSLT